MRIIWKRNTFKHITGATQWVVLGVLLLASSCGDITQVESVKSRVDSSSAYKYTGKGDVYTVNPVIATNNENISRADFGDRIQPIFVTNEPYLQYKLLLTQNFSTSSGVDVSSNDNLILVLNDSDDDTVKIQSNEGSWQFDQYDDSDEFYQVGTYYHVKDMMQTVFHSLRFAHSFTHLEKSMVLPPANIYNYANTKSIWLNEDGLTETLQVYSKCELPSINSYFNPTDDTICYGYTKDDTTFFMAQDPSVMYHEMGHAFVKVMMNQRNTKYDIGNGIRYTDFHSDLGELFYDEAGSINEGICDYFAYYMNGRKRIGEWAMGRYLASRPMSEEDSKHASGISTNPGERLAYPQYVNYDSNAANQDFEDIHLAGQIVSHYLVALTENFKDQCSMDSLTLGSATKDPIEKLEAIIEQRWENNYGTSSTLESDAKKHAFASSLVLMLLNETLAEMGDLYSRGSDVLDPDATGYAGLSSVYFNNMNEDNAFLWAQQVNPPNFRRFFRTFARKIKHYISEGACPAFTLDESEQLLDEYGLLLFKSYGDAGKSTDGLYTFSDFSAASLNVFSGQTLSPLSSNTEVNELNRRTSILISKEFVELPTDGDRSTAFVFDKPGTMSGLLANISFEGKPATTTEDVAGVEYNNGNGKISPGEVVGLALNLVNKSNSTIAGLQVLANDWDHMKLDDSSKKHVNRTSNSNYNSSTLASMSPCIIDGWPLETEGGVVSEGDSNTPGNCDYTTRTNKVVDASSCIANGTTNGSCSFFQSQNDAIDPDPYEDIEYLPTYELDSPQPICLVQYSDENETKWVSQNFYRKVDLDLSDSKCLNYPQMSGADFNPNECLVRFLPGATQATFSRMEPQKTWAETLFDEGENLSFNSSAAVIMEVNKWIEPGTTFNCRFRVRFSNCIDCWAKDLASDDFADYEFAGGEPYKVINFTFTVID
jgi:hypothetical protein